MTKDEKLHLSRVAGIGCICCRLHGQSDSPAEIHHIRTGTGAGRKASHYDTIPLCPYHHRTSNEALHVMGRKAWERHHGTTELDLLTYTNNLLRRAA